MSETKGKRIHMVANTHFDPVWLWRWDEAMSSIRATFRSALDRIRENDEFVYSFSCPPVFEWIRKTEPALFEEIRERVSQRRWHLTEGLWLQPDCNLACGESYIRQVLYGQRYLLQNFGCLSETAFNIDSFGHSAMLPQILSKAGIRYYVLSRPAPDDVPLRDPLFIWRGDDGSSLLAYRCGGDGGDIYPTDTAGAIDRLAECLDKYPHDLMLVYGVTDHGGAPTRQSILDIRSRGAEGAVFSDTGSFFHAQKREGLPEFRGELQVKYHGVFSDCNEVKKNNRLAEYAALNAEKAALLVSLVFGREYPQKELASCWRDILFNQFHDILGGSCIRDAYFDARNLHGRAIQTAAEVTHLSLQSLTARVALRRPEGDRAFWYLVVWNLNPFAEEVPVEAEVQWVWEFDWYQGPITVTDCEGNIIPCQVISEKPSLPGFRSRVVFRAALPALGYRAFLLRRGGEASPETTLSAGDRFLRSPSLMVSICGETGGIGSIRDLPTGKEWLRTCSIPLAAEDSGDTWAFNTQSFGAAQRFQLRRTKVLECGSVRARVMTESALGQSVLRQVFSIYRDGSAVEGAYRVDWREKHKALKLVFDTGIVDPVLTVSGPCCSVARRADGREMPVGGWLDVSDASGAGVTLMWDAVFAYDTDAGAVRATVLRSPIYGDLRMPAGLDEGREFDYIDQGITEGRWRAVKHTQPLDRAEAWRQTQAFQNEPVVVDESSHDGDLACERSFLAAEGSGDCIVTAVKKAEDGNAVILRWQNVTPAGTTASFRLDGLPGTGEVKTGPYEIKTVVVSRSGAAETDLLERPLGRTDTGINQK